MNVFHGIKCVVCGGTSTIAEWNRVTRQRFSERAIGLEESLYDGNEHIHVCPQCEAKCNSAALKEYNSELVEAEADTDNRCPRCGNHFKEYPAMSRRDNETEICATCGNLEAVFDIQRRKVAEHLEGALFALEQALEVYRVTREPSPWLKEAQKLMKRELIKVDGGGCKRR